MKKLIAILAVVAGLWATCDLFAATANTASGTIAFTAYGKVKGATAVPDYYTQDAVVGRRVKSVTFYGNAGATQQIRSSTSTGAVLWAGSSVNTGQYQTVPVDFTLPKTVYVTSNDDNYAAAPTTVTLIMHLGNW